MRDVKNILRTLTCICIGAAVFVSLSCSTGPKSIEIGLVAPLSGPSSDLGVHVRNAVDLYFDTIGERFENFPFLIKLVEADDTADPDISLTQIQTLHRQNIRVVIMNTYSAAAEKSLPWASENGMLVLSSTISAEGFSGKDDLFLRSAPSNAQYGIKIAENMLWEGQAAGVHIIRDTTNAAYAETISKALIATVEAGGGRIESDLSIDIAASVSLANEVLPKYADTPSAYVVIAGAINSAKVIQALKKGGHSYPVYMAPLAFSDELIKNGGSAVENSTVLWAENRRKDSTAYRAFETAFTARYGVEPNRFADLGWQAAELLTESLVGAESDDPKTVKDYMIRTREFETLGLGVRLDSNGDALLSDYGFYTVREGRFVKLNS